MTIAVDLGRKAIKQTKQTNFETFCDCSWAVTSTGPGGCMVLWFYVEEHLKAQPAVVVV